MLSNGLTTLTTVLICALAVSWLPYGQCQSPQPQTCNGLSNLCNMPVNEILYGTVHNAYSSSQAGFWFFPNHDEDPIVASLDFGYRGLQLDLCNCDNGDFVFCHGGAEVGCGFGERDPVDVFNQVNDWIIANPQNVIIIELQINQAAGGPISLTDIGNLLDQTNGFANRIYHHDDGAATWPTLQELIEEETQVIFFYVGGDHGAGYHPPGINYYYTHGMATHFSFPTVNDLRDRTVGTCTLRGGDPVSADWFLMNAFVTEERFGQRFVPSRDAASVINTIQFAQPLLEACEQVHGGKKVNMITVDFWDEGNLPALVNLHNSALIPTGGTSSPVTIINTPSPVTPPTQGPTPIPTPVQPRCEDTTSSFPVFLVGQRTCDWVEDNSWFACMLYSDSCPETCGDCN